MLAEYPEIELKAGCLGFNSQFISKLLQQVGQDFQIIHVWDKE